MWPVLPNAPSVNLWISVQLAVYLSKLIKRKFKNKKMSLLMDVVLKNVPWELSCLKVKIHAFLHQTLQNQTVLATTRETQQTISLRRTCGRNKMKSVWRRGVQNAV